MSLNRVRLVDESAAAGRAAVDGSFPWPFVVLGLAALAVGALFAFRPMKFRNRKRLGSR